MLRFYIVHTNLSSFNALLLITMTATTNAWAPVVIQVWQVVIKQTRGPTETARVRGPEWCAKPLVVTQIMWSKPGAGSWAVNWLAVGLGQVKVKGGTGHSTGHASHLRPAETAVSPVDAPASCSQRIPTD